MAVVVVVVAVKGDEGGKGSGVDRCRVKFNVLAKIRESECKKINK